MQRMFSLTHVHACVCVFAGMDKHMYNDYPDDGDIALDLFTSSTLSNLHYRGLAQDQPWYRIDNTPFSL